MIDTDKYEEFENAMNEGRIERVHCLWALAEVKRLRKALYWVRGEETRKEADYIWEGVEEILAGDPRWKEMIE